MSIASATPRTVRTRPQVATSQLYSLPGVQLEKVADFITVRATQIFAPGVRTGDKGALFQQLTQILEDGDTVNCYLQDKEITLQFSFENGLIVFTVVTLVSMDPESFVSQVVRMIGNHVRRFYMFEGTLLKTTVIERKIHFDRDQIIQILGYSTPYFMQHYGRSQNVSTDTMRTILSTGRKEKRHDLRAVLGL
jgi:hypothetical protein